MPMARYTFTGDHIPNEGGMSKPFQREFDVPDNGSSDEQDRAARRQVDSFRKDGHDLHGRLECDGRAVPLE